MDYKETVRDLRFLAKYVHDELNELNTDEVMKRAATAIETLLVERDALRAQPPKLDRSRWEGCEVCEGVKPDEWLDGIRFCPVCGKPITEEAWAEMERRINRGTTDMAQ